MKAFPMFIKTTGRRVVIIGGGEQAAQKARLILKTDAEIVFVAPELDEEIEALVSSGRASWHQGPLTKGFLDEAAMVFVASGCFAIDVSAHAIAKAARCPVNVVDQPHLCDITTPSLVDRDPVVVAIGTEGTAPVLARQIKTQIEQSLPQNLGGLAALAGRLRPSVTKNIARSKRREFWRWVFADKPRMLWDRGVEAHAAALIKDTIADRFQSDHNRNSSLTIIDSGTGERDLQTLRAVQRLQEADVIFYDRESDSEILELARRDADRVYLGNLEGHPSWHSNRIQSFLTARMKSLQNVAFLTSNYVSYLSDQTQWFRRFEKLELSLEFIPSVASYNSGARENPTMDGRRSTKNVEMSCHF
ncbi:MAG: NAD(P)-dependent oxidoreductase [Pseudomonadota bacterium]